MKWLFNHLDAHPLVSGLLPLAFGLVAYHYPPPLKELWDALLNLSLWELLIPLLAAGLFAKDTVEYCRRVLRKDVASAFASIGFALFAFWAAAHVGWGAMQLGYYLPFAIFPGLGIVAGLLFLASAMVKHALVGHLPKRVDTIAPRHAVPAESPRPKSPEIALDPVPNPYKGVVGIPRSQRMYHL